MERTDKKADPAPLTFAKLFRHRMVMVVIAIGTGSLLVSVLYQIINHWLFRHPPDATRHIGDTIATTFIASFISLLVLRYFRKTHSNLDRERVGRVIAEQQAEQCSLNLEDRYKELSTLFDVSTILQDQTKSPAEVLRDIALALPNGWQYPKITAARVSYDNMTSETSNFRETAWKQRADFVTQDQKKGFVEVAYLEKRDEEDEGPFFTEERKLINTVSEYLWTYFERRRADEQFLLARQAIEISPIILFQSKPEAGWPHLILVSANISQWGYSAVELVSEKKKFYELIHPEDRERILQEMRYFTEHALSKITHQFRIVTKNGDARLVNCYIVLERGSSGEPLLYRGIMIDVTELKETETKLDESEKRYRTLIETSPEAISLADMEGNLLLTNQGTLKMHGYTRMEEVVGKKVAILIAPEEHAQIKDNIHKAVIMGTIFNIQHTLLKKDGSRFPAEMSLTINRDENGNPVSITTIARDITERKHSERSLKESEARYRTLFESSSDAIMLLNEDSFFDCNETTLKMFGVTRKEFIKLHPSELSPPEQVDGENSRTKADRMISQAFREGKNAFEWTHRRKNGADFPAEVWLTAFRLEGRQVLQATVRDITERKRAEKTLKESEDQFRTIFDSAQDAIIIADPETRRFYLSNVKAGELLGYSPSEIQSLSVDQIHPPDSVPDQLATFNRFKKGEHFVMQDAPILRKDGRILSADISATLIPIGGKQYLMGIFRDTTQRKKAQEELLLKTALLEAESETSADGILVVDDNGNVLIKNNRFGEMWRIPQSILDTHDDKKLLQHVVDQLKDPQNFTDKVNYLYAHKDEKSQDELEFRDGRFFDRYSSPLKDSKGNYYGRIWYFHDITERNKMEDALEESRDYLDKIINSVADPIFVKDRKHRWVMLNDAYCEFMGYPLKELIGKSDIDYFPKEQADVFWAKDELVFESGEDNVNEEMFTDSKGTAHTIITKKALYTDLQGNKFIVGIIRDITARKLAEKRLSDLNTTLLSFGSIPTENIHRLVALCGNLLCATCTFYNRKEEENIHTIGAWNAPPDYPFQSGAKGRICTDVIDRQSDEVFLVRDLQNTPYAQTAPLIKKYGFNAYLGKAVKCQDRYVGSLCAMYQQDFVPTKEDEKLLGILASAISIEEEREQANRTIRESYEKLKEMQAQLIQSEKLAALGQFAAGVAHEVKNPLGVVLGGIEFLEKKIPHTDMNVTIALKKIRESALRSSGILETVLKFIRPADLKIERVKPHELIQETLGLVKFRNPMDQVRVVQFAEDIELEMDRNQMQQVFFNLLINAVEAMPKGGELTIKTYRSEVLNHAFRGDWGTIEIIDSGEGIAPENTPRLFEPFFTTKRERKGTGLGLYAAKMIIDNHGGLIKITSDPKKGTTVKVLMPFKQEPKPKPAV